MTFKVSLNIDGDASGAKRALDSVTAAIRGTTAGFANLNKQNGSLRSSVSSVALAADDLSGSFKGAYGAIGGLEKFSDSAADSMGRLGHQVSKVPPELEAAGKKASFFNSALNQTATAITLVDGPLGGFASRVTAIASIFRELPPVLAGFTLAVTAITAAGTAGVVAFADYERQLKTTEAIIKSTGGSAGKTVADIDALAKSLASRGLGGAPAIREAANQLLTFRSIAGETFDRTLALSQDLAADGFGEVEQAAVQLGKALEDPINGIGNLKELGISFTTAQKDVITALFNTGQIAKEQGLILDQVAGQVGGAAAAGGGGLAGAFDELKDAALGQLVVLGKATAEFTGLEAILRQIAAGMNVATAAMDPNSASLDDLQAQYAELTKKISAARVELEALKAQEAQEHDISRSKAIKQAPEAIAGLEKEKVALAERIKQLTEAQTAAEKKAAEEAKERSADRLAAIMSDLQKERDAVSQTVLEKAQLVAIADAGVAANSAEAQSIRDFMAATAEAALEIEKKKDAEQAAADAAAESQKAIDDLITSLEQDIAVMRAADPVMAQMIAQRAALAAATDNERAKVEGLIEAKEREISIQNVRNLGTKAEDKLRDAQLGIKYANDPAGLAGARADIEIRKAQAPLREGASGEMIRALDGDAKKYVSTLQQAAQLEEDRRQAAKSSSKSGGGGAGAAIKAETDEVQKLIDSLTLEHDILAEADPVQKEMIRNREILSQATVGQTQAIQDLITKNTELTKIEDQREKRIDDIASAQEDFAQIGGDAFEEMIFQGASLNDVLGNMLGQLAQLAVQAALFGEGPFATLFGGSDGGGLFNLLANSIKVAGPAPFTPSPIGLAGGGRVSGRGSGTSDSIPAWLSNGEFVVNAAATRKARPLLERINAGFAEGGYVGGGSGMQSFANRNSEPQQIHLVIDPSAEFDVRVDERARGTAVKVFKEGIGVYSRKHLPTAARKAVHDGRSLG